MRGGSLGHVSVLWSLLVMSFAALFVLVVLFCLFCLLCLMDVCVCLFRVEYSCGVSLGHVQVFVIGVRSVSCLFVFFAMFDGVCCYLFGVVMYAWRFYLSCVFCVCCTFCLCLSLLYVVLIAVRVVICSCVCAVCLFVFVC